MDKNKLGGPWHVVFLVLFLLFAAVHGGKERGERDRERDRTTSAEDPGSPGVPHGDSEVAGSSSISMSTAPGSLAMGSSGGSSHVKYDKYADKYADKYGSSSLYPSSSAQHASAVNYYSAYGYPSPHASSSSSSSGGGSASSHGGNGGSSSSNSHPYSYSGSSHTNYYSPYMTAEPYYERGGRDFSTRASNNIPIPAASSNYGYETSGPEFGGQAMASSHGGHGGGGGWGWKAQQYSGSKVDTSAIGLLGLIGLFAIMQQVLQSLTTTTTTTTMAGRKKRDLLGIDDNSEDIPEPPVQDDGSQRRYEISLKVLPSFNLIAHAREGRIPLNCTHREVCVANQLLVKELGVHGRSVGSVISSAITKLLKEADKSGTIGKELFKAGYAGRSGENCEIIYPVCSALHRQGVYSLPLLMQPHHLAHLTPVSGVRSKPNLPKTKPNAI